MGLCHLMKDAPPQLVLSGVNRGLNLGMETVFSGTVGGAMTAMMLGVPALALSQAFTKRDAVPWDTARTLGAATIRQLWAIGWGKSAVPEHQFLRPFRQPRPARSPWRARARARLPACTWIHASIRAGCPTTGSTSSAATSSKGRRATTARCAPEDRRDPVALRSHRRRSLHRTRGASAAVRCLIA